MLHDPHALSQPPFAQLCLQQPSGLVWTRTAHGTKHNKTAKCGFAHHDCSQATAEPFFKFSLLLTFPAPFLLLTWRARKHPGKTGCQADTGGFFELSRTKDSATGQPPLQATTGLILFSTPAACAELAHSECIPGQAAERRVGDGRARHEGRQEERGAKDMKTEVIPKPFPL